MGSASRDQAVKACDFWSGLEYMNLVQAPEPDEKRRVFTIAGDSDLPWNSPVRKRALHASNPQKYTGQIAYCGLFGKRDYTVALRAMLGSMPMVAKDMRKAGDAATLLIPLDDTGRVCGEVFISSLPWMMGRLAEGLTKHGAAEVSFAGFDEFQEELMLDVRRLLVQLQLISEESANPQEMRERPAGTQEGGAVSGRWQGNSLEGTAANRAGKPSGSLDMKPLEIEHVAKLLQLIWKRCGWVPSWGPYAEESDANGQAGEEHLIRIKVLTLTRYLDKTIDLGALNSMVANDVMRVRAQLANSQDIEKAAGPALQQYLKLVPEPERIDLRDRDEDGGLGVFVRTLSPEKLPQGAWPDYPLVSAQQFAVNMSRVHLADGGLYGVNGPPGTGKSTLLRDVIADQLVSRATIMVGFNNPLDAFPRRGDIEGYQYGFQELDQELHGHGIVVASSNNGAVENVIKDLPKLSDAMANSEATYFRAVAESVAAGPKDKDRALGSAWGLVAALMGSSDRRRAFMSRFWFEPKPDSNEAPRPNRLRSLKGIIDDGTHGAMLWRDAQRAFKESTGAVTKRAQDLKRSIDLHRDIENERHALQTSSEELAMLRSLCDYELRNREGLASDVALSKRRVDACKAARRADIDLAGAQANLAFAQQAAAGLPTPASAAGAVQIAKASFDGAQRQSDLVLATKPGFFKCLFNWSAGDIWRAKMESAAEVEQRAHSTLSAAQTTQGSTQSALALVTQRQQQLNQQQLAHAAIFTKATGLGLVGPLTEEMEQALAAARDRAIACHAASAATVAKLQKDVVAAERTVEALENSLRKNLREWSQFSKMLEQLGESFYESNDLLSMRDKELQLIVPFKDDQLRALRVRVFKDAMDVNQSFVVGAWAKLKPTLSAFVDYQGGKFSQAQAAEAAVHMWNAFFMVVPVVSSTFASFDKLFAGLSREQLGILLIDEAGQSTPQNAVGAVWRSRRVMAVGDPLQLEPVVTQPVEAISAWRTWIGANGSWTPPACSAQVLADAMTPYGTTLLPEGLESRKVWVGSPLRVHRRCLSPMFDVANKIAYDELMVHGVHDKTAHDDWLGHSRWLDVTGDSNGHWVQAQGEAALQLIEDLLETDTLKGRLKNDKGEWHINVITPYKDVGHEFSKMLRHRFDIEDIGRMTGTVHTFQGKEADVVILLLGGNPDRAGAVSFFAGNEQAPNLLNVAVTRAKMRLYVVGDEEFWTDNSGTFRHLAEQLKAHHALKEIQKVSQRAKSAT